MEPAPERLNELLRYDLKTGFLFWRISRGRTAKAGSKAGRTNYDGYIHIRVDGRAYYAHRLVWVMHHGSVPHGLVVDHLDHDRTNQRLNNLRLATHIENARKVALHRHNTSGVNGVSFHKTKRRWIAFITISGRRSQIGSFAEKSEAVRARRAEEQKHGFHRNHGMKKATTEAVADRLTA